MRTPTELRIPETSVEYVTVPITGTRVTIDTGWPVHMAIIPDGKDGPEAADWAIAAWGADSVSIEALVGPGTSHVLSEGRYAVWVKIEASPEAPVRRAGTLVVT